MTDTASRTHITEVGTVIVPVSDQDRAITFYTEKLGLEKRSDTPFGRGDRWVEVAPAGASTSIALMPPQEGGKVGLDTGIAFKTTDADADHARLREQGVDVDEQVMRMGDPIPPMFFFRDGDGNTLLIVETS